MKITIDTSISGKFAKAGTDIKDGDRIKIMDAGQVLEGKFGEQYIFKVFTQKREEFNLAFNRTSRNNLARGYGQESEDWKEKVAKCFVVRQMVGDGLKNVLYLAPDGWVMTDDGEFQPEDEFEANDSAPLKADNSPNPDDIPF